MQRSVLLFVWLASSFVLLSQPGPTTGPENSQQRPFFEFPDESGVDDGYSRFLQLQTVVQKPVTTGNDNQKDDHSEHKDAYSVTFEVNMTNAVAEGDVNFNPDIHSVYVTGTFSDWVQPGTNPDYELTMAPKASKNNNTDGKGNKIEFIYTITLDITEGEHMYKYFLVEDTPTWNLGEWAGDPNRSAFIDGPVTLTDVWGSLNSFFAGGTGVDWDPFLVATAEHLHNVRMFPYAAYRQIADIDLAYNGWNEGDGWLPIGDNESPFQGFYDGNGYFIDNMVINRPEAFFAGLFGRIVYSYLLNIRLRNVQITALNRVGAICGVSQESVISGCSADGNIAALGNWAGGLVGINYYFSSIHGSYAAVNTDAVGYSTGGLVGSNENGSSIINSYATGNVSGLRNLGGLVGYSTGNCSVEFCYSTGYVSADIYTGGLIGRQNGYNYVGLSYWNAETSGQAISAGGVGLTSAQMMQNNSFEMWDFDYVWNINTGTTFPYLKFQTTPGDYNYPPPFLSPSGLFATGTDQTITISWLPPSVGAPTGYILFRDGEVHANPVSGATTFTDTGLENYILHTYYLIAQYDDQQSRPSGKVLSFAHTGFAGGNGSFEAPYLVSTPEQLFTVRHFPDSYFQQTSDIDLAASALNQGEGWLPISTYFKVFRGQYDGDGHVVSNLFIDRANNTYQGLFSSLEGVVMNLGVVDANISAPSGMAGILVGSNFGQISKCYSTGEITSDGTFGRIGGLTGWNAGYILESWSSANVSSNGLIVGGLTGANSSGMIMQSYSLGNVTGESSVAGLAGINQSSVIISSFSNSNVVAYGARSGGITSNNSFGSMISDSYSTGSTVGNNTVGGVSGYLSEDSYLWNCYAAGPVSGVDNTGGIVALNQGFENVMGCFWDTYATGQQISAGGTPKNTQEMVMQGTFTDWNFNEIWNILEGESYPYLWWQIEPGAHNFPNIIPVFYYLSLVANPPIGGTVTGAGSYAYEQVVAISALSNQGYRFTGWTGHTSFVDHPDHEACNVTMPAENIVLTANFEVITNINESTVAGIVVYPNPATNKLWIEFDNTSGGPVLVQVSNVLGKVADQKEIARQGTVNLEIDVSSYQAGLYIVKIQTSASTMIKKVLIRN